MAEIKANSGFQSQAPLNAADQQLYDSLKDKFQGFDSDGNAVFTDNGVTSSLNSNDFSGVVGKLKQDNPSMQNGSYEDKFNQNQFNDITKQGNSFKGLDAAGNSIFKNAQGDLQNYGQTGGFADYAKKQLANQQFDISNESKNNDIAGQNQVVNPNLISRKLASGSKLGGQNQFQDSIANSFNINRDDTSSTDQGNNAGSFAKFQQSQMEKLAQQKQAQQDKAQAKQAIQNKAQASSNTPKMMSGFAKAQAKQPPTIQQQIQNKAVGTAKNTATGAANQAASPYVQQGASQVEQATGINPLGNVKSQAINQAANATGVDAGIIGTGADLLNGNVAQNAQNLAMNQAKQQALSAIADNTDLGGAGLGAVAGLMNGQGASTVAKNLAVNQAANSLADATGADAGMLGSGLGLVAGGGNIAQNATNVAKQQAMQQGLTAGAEALGLDASGIPVSAITSGAKTLFGGGSDQQKGAAIGNMAARAAAMNALGAATGGLGYLANPELLNAGAALQDKAASGVSNALGGGTVGKVAASPLAATGETFKLGANALNRAYDIAGNNVGDETATASNAFKGAKEGVSEITKGNIGSGLKSLGNTAIKTALDAFIRNPANLASNVFSGAAHTVQDVVHSIGNFFCFTGDTEIMMENGKFKKIKDIKLDDKIMLGGKVTGIGEAKADDLFDFNGVKVSSGHAVFENGIWKRVKDSEAGKSLGDKETLVFPMATEKHLIVTKDGQVWADMSEVDDPYNMSESEKIDYLNKQKNRNRMLNVFIKSQSKKI